mmetsp:Transcript_22069/g.29502  ORF Transcript_22069/g.29502 Transcript_22069/m.29502 type:complete len:107 (+) Transcript_22069:1318-1638(+)
MTAFNSGFFSITPSNFAPMTEIFVLFVKNGFLSPEQQNKFFLSYVLALKKTMLPSRGKEEKIDSRDLIKVTWALSLMEKPSSLSIPLLPKLFEQLAHFERPSQPLS